MSTSESTIALDTSAITGAYQLVSSENYDKYLSALNVGYLQRKVLSNTSPMVEITNNGDQWTVRTTAMSRATEQTFQLGQEFDAILPNGEAVKAVVSAGDQSLIEVQKRPVGRTVEIKRDFSQPQQMTETLTAESAVATRIYKKTT